MPISDYKDIVHILKSNDILFKVFDMYRIVEPQSGILVEIQNGLPQKTSISCNEVWGTSHRCRNCTSIRAHYTKETLVKFEYSKGAVLLIVSLPLEIDGEHLVVEMIKDITKSMIVDVQDESFSNEVSSIIDNLNRISSTDPLTGLQNRRYLEDKLPLALKNCLSMGLPLSLALFDIDHFKRVNDDYGHQCGDIVLKGISSIMHSYIRRDSDFVVRYGGEEILLCFPGASLGDCVTICTRIRAQIKNTAFNYGDTLVNVTISAGAAEATADGIADKDTLIALADKRLYQAKHLGRDRIVSENIVDC